MILKMLEQNWDRIRLIGAEAEERGRLIGVRPPWTDNPDALAYQPKDDDSENHWHWPAESAKR